ncbi:PAS domain-containing protein [Adhaeribacter aquaticus]|uniref:PAS domain-containing protein n=1 Tax=Adhaeribacter aquaticus TaxID=299567 RepID=UPI00041A50E7|nr:PAS domain-containing protein [Adhaeribacter aquaticus]
MISNLPDSSINFRAIFRALPGLLVAVSPEFKILAVSKSFERVSGTTESDLIGTCMAEFCAKFLPGTVSDHQQKWQNSLNFLIQYQKPHNLGTDCITVAIPHGQSETKYWHTVNTPVFDELGQLLYILHEAKDITNEYLASQEAKQNKERFETLSLATNDAVWDWNLETDVITWNEAYKTLFGYIQIDATLTSWYHLIHPEDRDRVSASLQKVKANGDKFWSDEYRFLCADGSYCFILDRGYLHYDQQGKPCRMIGSMLDITLQKKYEKQLQEQADFFQFLADSVPTFIWTTNPDGVTDYRNKYYLDYVGKDKSATFHFSELLPPDTREQVATQWRTNLMLGQPFEMEVHIRAKNGEYRWTLARATPKYNTNGEIIKWVGTATDIDAQKKLNEHLIESTKRFQFLSDTVPAFIWTSNPDGTTDYRNKHYYNYIGKHQVNNPDFDWSTVIHPEDREDTVNKWIQSVNTGRPYEIEHRIHSESGEFRWILSRAHAMRDEAGAIVKWFGTSIDIQEQKEVQQVILERDAYLQRMLSDAPILFFMLRTENLVCAFTNPSFNKLYNNRTFIGLPAKEAWPELEAQDFIHIIENVYHSGTAYKSNEYPLNYDRYGNGEMDSGFFNFSIQPLLNEKGQVEGVMCFAVEVTEQVLAKHQAQALANRLQHEKENFRFLAESVPQLVWSAHPDGSVDYFSQQWQQYTGVDPLQSLGWGWEDALYPEDLPLTLVKWNNSAKTGEPYEIEYRLRKFDGTYRWFLGRGVPMRDQYGTIVKWFGTCTDIHEQKLIQEKLEESTNRFRFLAEAMPQKVWTAQADGYIDYFNQHWLTYTGLSFENLKGFGWTKAFHPEDQHLTTVIWENALQQATDFQMEHRLVNADGTYRWHLSRGIPMKNDTGEVAMWVGTNTDIHEQKIAQQNLIAINNELTKRNDDLDRFVYTASHDLKLPIINMGSIFEELVANCEFTDPDNVKLIQMFHKSLEQIHTTITDLSEIAKIQKNIDAETEEINVPELLEEVKLSIQEMIKTAGATILTDFTGCPKINFSRANLRSILYNLVSNAIKYASPERLPVVKISITPQDDYNVLSVQDNGLGLNLDQHQNKLFQMFKRFHNHVPGTGLGLYIINRIMQNNNGYVQVESKENEGSTFRVYFKMI